MKFETVSKESHDLLSETLFTLAPTGNAAQREYFSGLLDAFFPAGTSFRVTTFGCQMNERDSEKISGMLSAMGLIESTTEEEADIVVFNTCTVRENANDHLYGRLGRLKGTKALHPEKIIILSGCMMQESVKIDIIKEKFPYVDIIFGTHNIYELPRLLYALLLRRNGSGILFEGSDRIRFEKALVYGDRRTLRKLSSKPVVSVLYDNAEISEDMPTKRKFFFKQGVNIMYGCDNFCSYCIVPYVRGREKSRKPADIYDEIKTLAQEGVIEIMLLGQNVNSYNGGISFSGLLLNIDRIAEREGIERVRFMTSHPKDLSEELIDVISSSKKVCRQFHLPLQAGSDRILSKMNRRYTSETFIKKALSLKEKVPGITLSTDIMVGFPGETEEDFQKTLDVMKEVEFDFAYTFIYSEREGTPAASFDGKVPKEEVRDRFKRLLELQNTVTARHLEKRVGSIENVLFEEQSEYNTSLISGKTEGGANIHVAGDVSHIGKLEDVLITKNRGFYLCGEFIDDDTGP